MTLTIKRAFLFEGIRFTKDMEVASSDHGRYKESNLIAISAKGKQGQGMAVPISIRNDYPGGVPQFMRDLDKLNNQE